MEMLLILILLVIALDIASLHRGFDSTEKIDSPEWERRAAWYAHLAGREEE
jgi:hypothetical protein